MTASIELRAALYLADLEALPQGQQLVVASTWFWWEVDAMPSRLKDRLGRLRAVWTQALGPLS